MTIEYQDKPAFFGDASAPKWLPGELTESDGGFVVKLPDGNVLSVQPNGAFESRDAAGPWETCQQSLNINALLYTPNGITYAVIYRGV